MSATKSDNVSAFKVYVQPLVLVVAFYFLVVKNGFAIKEVLPVFNPGIHFNGLILWMVTVHTKEKGAESKLQTLKAAKVIFAYIQEGSVHNENPT